MKEESDSRSGEEKNDFRRRKTVQKLGVRGSDNGKCCALVRLAAAIQS